MGLANNSNNLTAINELYNKLIKIDQTLITIDLNKQHLTTLLRFSAHQSIRDMLLKQPLLIDQQVINWLKIIMNHNIILDLINLYSQYNEKGGSNVYILLGLGILYFKVNNFVQAKKFIELSINVLPTNDGYTYLLYIACTNKDDKLISATMANINTGNLNQ
jgi:hypothetical protein